MSQGRSSAFQHRGDGPTPAPSEPNERTTDPNGIKTECAVLMRPFLDSDVLVEPVDEAGQTAPRRRKTPEIAG